ncbi:MAG: NAD(P)/FAD-dependent oxidoreductase [Clostridiales bacterium]|nr:NAD(P)/FAD-dependent oxidoreductase [Clostridiales bacterium]
MFDVAVIGGGVIGGLILRRLSSYNLNVCLLEKANDICMGQSKANSGIVHAGFDAKEGTLKAKFNLLGNEMMEQTCRELGVKYVNNGSLVVAFSTEDCNTLYDLKKRGELNGVKGLEIIGKEKLQTLEPNISNEAVGALYAPTGGIVCPYELTVSAIGNAMDNGASLYTNFEVSKIDKEEIFTIYSANCQSVRTKAIINCAGYGSQKVANLVGDYSFKIGARRGEYILLDRESGDFVRHTLFFTPTKKGKGILVSPTVDGNIILGPTAEEIDGNRTETTADGLQSVVEKANEMCKNVPVYNSITSFSGVRAYCDKHDFIIEESSVCKGFFNCAGIESPGLTSAPAIAEYVVDELIGSFMLIVKKQNFNPIRKPDYFFSRLSIEEKNEIIRQNPSYGRIVCRCEQITEGEIIRALTENPKAEDIDGVKRRTRAGMGRCQGGFCQPFVAELISKVRGIPLEKVTKKGEGSELLVGKTK